MDCSEAKSHLSAFASGLTNDLDRTEIEEHLTSCEDCSLEVELLRGRASGQNSSPKPSDWTLEKIFGSEAGGERAESAEESPAREAASSPAPGDVAFQATQADASPPPAPPAEPAEPRPSLILPLPATTESNEDRAKAMPGGAKSKSGSWDFEPADVGKEAAPPEESVAFAEQALNRKRDGATKSKAAAMRALVWTLGGVAGLGLLGVSVWIAMAVHQVPRRELSTGAARSKPAQDAAAADSSGSADTSSVVPPVEQPIQARTLPGVPSSPSPPEPTRAASAPTPAPTSVSIARTTSPAPSGSMPAPKTAAPAPKPAAPAPSASTPAPNAKPAPAAPKPAQDDAISKKGVIPPKASPKPVTRDDDDMWPTDDPVRVGTTGAESSSAKPPTAAAPTPVPSGAVATPPAPPTMASGTTETAPPAAPSAPHVASPPSNAAAPSTPPTPIDRLHAATEKAAADRDLAALRQLKTAWKALLRTTVGRERSRTKREYADCLWAIQGITGRDADRLECLNAYREYLLSAPAGGTDARSAERLRQLEDALHEND